MLLHSLQRSTVLLATYWNPAPTKAMPSLFFRVFSTTVMPGRSCTRRSYNGQRKFCRIFCARFLVCEVQADVLHQGSAGLLGLATTPLSMRMHVGSLESGWEGYYMHKTTPDLSLPSTNLQSCGSVALNILSRAILGRVHILHRHAGVMR